MDNDRFDALIRRLADTRSRRGALVGLAGGALGLLGLTEASAKNHRRHKHKRSMAAHLRQDPRRQVPRRAALTASRTAPSLMSTVAVAGVPAVKAVRLQ